MVILAPSILSADFGRLEPQAREALDAGTSWIHIDVMDGHFVPNITVGPAVVRALRRLADAEGATLDVHLMIEQPERHIGAFAEAGADIITVHVETCPHIHRTIQYIQSLDVKAGVTLNPGTPAAAVGEVLSDVDLVLVMSVNPGFGGQRFISRSLDKIRVLRGALDMAGSRAYLEVDGGIKVSNAARIVAAGADVLVVGSAIFAGEKPVADNVAAFRRALVQHA